MLRQNMSRGVRFLRYRSGWRQEDLATRAGVSREMVSRLERGAVASLTLRSLERLASAVGGTLHLELRWRGEQLDRLIDAGHAALEQRVTKELRDKAWNAEVEMSFNVYGDRGRVDALAFHPQTLTLLVVEVKTRLGDVQAMLGALDIKTRLGPQLARRAGWPTPARVVPCLVIADGRTARRVVASHPDLFARFSLRGAAARRWLRSPTAEPVSGVLVFEPVPDSLAATMRRRMRRQTVPDSHLATDPGPAVGTRT